MSTSPERAARPLGAFVGRDDEVARVLAWLAQGERLIVVTGPPGVGKRRLAREVIARAPFHVELLHTAGAPAAHVEDLLAALERHPERRVLVAATAPLGRPEERVLTLDGLAETDAVALFEAHAARAGTALAPADRAALPALVAALDGLPLAIEAAARRADVLPPARALAALERTPDALALLGPTLRERLTTAWDALTPDQQATLAALTAFARPFDLEAAQALLALPLAHAAALVESLVRSSWLVAAGAAGISLRALSRAFVNGHSVAAPDPARDRVARLTLDAIERRLRSYRAHGGTRLAHTLTADHAALWSALHTRSGIDPLRALELALEIGARLALTLGDAEVATAHATLDDTRDAPLADRAGAHLALTDGHLARAEFERAGALVDALDEAIAGAPPELVDDVLRGRLLLRRAAVSFETHVYDDAEAHYRAALALLEPTRAPGDHARALGSLALCDVMRGRLDQALATLARAGDAFERAGEHDLLPRVSANRAYVLIHLERWRDATAEIETGLAGALRLGRERERAFLVGELGRVAWRQQRLSEARTHYHAAAAVAQGIGAHFMQAKILMMIAWLDLERGAQAALDELVPRIRDAARASEDTMVQATLEAFDAVRRALAARPPDPRAQPVVPDAALADRGLFGAAALGLRSLHRVLADPRAEAGSAVVTAAPVGIGHELDDLRRIHDFAVLIRDALAGARDVLVVDLAGEQVRPGSGAWLGLARRPVLKRLLLALVDARADTPQAALDVEALAHAAWGDERMTPEARDNRLHVSLTKLRHSGLDDMIEHVEEGWRLTPGTRLLFAARAALRRADHHD